MWLMQQFQVFGLSVPKTFCFPLGNLFTYKSKKNRYLTLSAGSPQTLGWG
jgi:hypothetical protein